MCRLALHTRCVLHIYTCNAFRLNVFQYIRFDHYIYFSNFPSINLYELRIYVFLLSCWCWQTSACLGGRMTYVIGVGKRLRGRCAYVVQFRFAKFFAAP